MRNMEAGTQPTRKHGYATNSSLAGINHMARKRSGRRINRA